MRLATEAEPVGSSCSALGQMAVVPRRCASTKMGASALGRPLLPRSSTSLATSRFREMKSSTPTAIGSEIPPDSSARPDQLAQLAQLEQPAQPEHREQMEQMGRLAQRALQVWQERPGLQELLEPRARLVRLGHWTWVTATPLGAMGLSSALPLAAITQRWVIKRCIATRRAARTPLWGALRSIATYSAATTQPSVPLRSSTAAPATTTRPPVQMPFVTAAATTTRPTVLVRSRTTSAAATQPAVGFRSIATQPASTTRPTVLLRSIATPPAAST